MTLPDSFLIGPNLTIGDLRKQFERDGVPFPENPKPTRQDRGASRHAENRALAKQVFAKTSWRCWYCGIRFGSQSGRNSDATIDHIVAKVHGGSNRLENLVPCCRLCNHRKADQDMESFRSKWLEGQPFHGESGPIT